MGKSLMQIVNQENQDITENSIVSLGSIQRRYGSSISLTDNYIHCKDEGYYKIDVNVCVLLQRPCLFIVALFDNGIQIPGCIAYFSTEMFNTFSTLSFGSIIRKHLNDPEHKISLVVVSGNGSISNVSIRVEKS